MLWINALMRALTVLQVGLNIEMLGGTEQQRSISIGPDFRKKCNNAPAALPSTCTHPSQMIFLPPLTGEQLLQLNSAPPDIVDACDETAKLEWLSALGGKQVCRNSRVLAQTPKLHHDMGRCRYTVIDPEDGQDLGVQRDGKRPTICYESCKS